MYIAVVPTPDGGGWLWRLGPDRKPTAEPRMVPALAHEIQSIEAAEAPRWVFARVADDYPPLIAAGAWVERCIDVSLTEAILLSVERRVGEPSSVAAAHARLQGRPPPIEDATHPAAQDTLFDVNPPRDDRATLTALVDVFTAQLPRHTSNALRLLTTAESVGGLIAAELTHHGLPWRSDIHDATLTELLGPRPGKGFRPKKLQALADEINAAFGKVFNPDSPQQLIHVLHDAGLAVETTRAYELSELDHPGIPPLLRYKELSRIFTANGWNWAAQWVGHGPDGPGSRQQRFRPRYIVGGVVTGRWATDGGGALQIPKTIRRAAMADDGHRLVVADASQLEPRVLAAMARDNRMIQAAARDDLYAELAPTFGGSRSDAKIAMLSAMYGGTAGNASALLHVLQQRFPNAYALVEDAARAGERGEVVTTWLGRTCPQPSDTWWSALNGQNGYRAARDRGRFTRNFIVQGTAMEWALAMMAFLRRRLHTDSLGELVFFLHDEIIVHCTADVAERVVAAIDDAATQATTLLFGDTSVRIPLKAQVVNSYADAHKPSGVSLGELSRHHNVGAA